MSITETGPDLMVEEHPPADSAASAPSHRSDSQSPGSHIPDSGAGSATGRSDGDRRSSRPSFTITDAAAACAVSRKTITRKLPELALSGAAKDDDGIWRIPVEALLAVGLHPGRSVPEEQQPKVERAADPVAARPDRPATGPEMVTIPRDRWDDVRIRLARAEAEAAERSLALADARLALRALTAGPSRATDGAAATGPEPGSPQMSSPQSSGSSGPIALGGPDPSVASTDPGPARAPEAASDLFSVRSQAARSGAYVAIPAPPLKKRRWWQSL